MSLFIKKYKYKNGRIYCSIVDGYRINGKTKHKVIQKYGYYDVLENEYGDADKYLNSELEKLKKEFITKITATFDTTKENTFDDDTFNIGCLFKKYIPRIRY